MSRSVLTKTLVGLTGFFLLIAWFQATPISISLGQNEKVMNGKKRLDLPPGQCYMVYSDKPIPWPDGVYVWQASGGGTGFRHDGMHKNKPEHCGGYIKMVLRDSGCIEYQCILCQRKWTRDAEGKLVKGCDGD